MNLIHPQWSAPDNVKAISTTRLGGVSDGVYKGFNLGLHVSDDQAKVNQNRDALQRELGLKHRPYWLDQVHSTIVSAVDSSLCKSAQGFSAPQADGSFTFESNLACVVMTADCLPLLLTNREGNQVAAVHAGWRGLADGVIDNAIKSFSCPTNQIIAWLGPCIGANAFEVGSEVRDKLGGPDKAYKPSPNSGRYMADLPALAADRLRTLAVEDISFSQLCTYSDTKRFFSYRRDGQCGRMASLIWMEKDV
jgi:YfiH family protein